MSCCGNELIYNSVLSEVVASNIEQIVYLIDIVTKFWVTISIVCLTTTVFLIYTFKPARGVCR